MKCVITRIVMSELQRYENSDETVKSDDYSVQNDEML
jgi:hypothetical protein